MSLPEKLFKYRSWDNEFHRNVLLKNELYLASPKSFNDPFDSRIPQNFTGLTEEEKNKYIDELAISQFEKSEQSGRNFEIVLKNLERRMADLNTFQKVSEKNIFNMEDRHYGILSLSKRWNGILLWSHYADSHKGICIGFWTKKLWDSGLFGKIGKVNYEIDFPLIKPHINKNPMDVAKQSFIQFYTKSEDWLYEEEYRIINIYFPVEAKDQDRLIKIPDNIISEVIMGINISEEHKDEILNICMEKKIPVYQAKKKDFKFEVDRDLVS